VAAHAVEPTTRWLGVLMASVFLLSFAHQPLTLGLVYGDRVQYDAHRMLYGLAPVVFAVLVVAGLSISLTVVAIVAGLWNIEHTLMQRYGITRIYGRKAGDDQGGAEKRMLVSWLVLALIFVAGFVDIPRLVAKVGMGSTNARGMATLHSLRPVAQWLAVPAAVAVVVFVVQWARAERSLGATANRAKHLYLASTAALLLLVLIDPIAAFVGYVASHSVEYFVIVNRSVRTRAGLGDTSPIATVTATRARRAGMAALYAGAVLTLVALTYRVWDGHIYQFAILFLGGMHILYDGFIWKLRRPALAKSLGAA
jgi:hypothetical protein